VKLNTITLTSSAVDCGFNPRSGQTKDYKIGICCLSAKHVALRRKNKDWLARNQDNVSEWGGESVYIRGVPNACLSKHRCQKRSDWMFTINHPIAVNITNKCGLRNKFTGHFSKTKMHCYVHDCTSTLRIWKV
jgi:hypothetical protein